MNDVNAVYVYVNVDDVNDVNVYDSMLLLDGCVFVCVFVFLIWFWFLILSYFDTAI